MQKRLIPIKRKQLVEICILLGFNEDYSKLTETEKSVLISLVFIASRYDETAVKIIFKKFKDAILEALDKKADVKLGISDNRWAALFVNGVPQKWYDIQDNEFADEIPPTLEARLFDMNGITKLLELKVF